MGIKCNFKNQTKILFQIPRKDSKLASNHQDLSPLDS